MNLKKSRGRLLAAAVIFHVGVCVLVLAAGRLNVAPGTFDRDGVARSFASDGVLYRNEAELLARGITSLGPAVLLTPAFQFHVKIFALLFKSLGWLAGRTVLCVEPLNALCYAATLLCVFRLGRDAFDERAGLVAAALVALWPSYLLHTTQFLKDPLIIAALLALLAGVSAWLKGDFTRRAGAAACALGVAAAALVWHLRSELIVVTLGAEALGLALLVARQLRERRRLAANTACAALVLLATLLTPFVIPRYRTPPRLAPTDENRAPRGAGFFESVTALRRESAETAVSAIDAEVEFREPSDLLRYLPRAALVGLCAPFPSMWFGEAGQAGRAARLLSGAETLAAYALMLAALFGVWAARKNLSVYVLVGVAVTGATALGVVVANVGTLYRMRYPFWMLLVVLGAGGAVRAAERLRARVAASDDYVG